MSGVLEKRKCFVLIMLPFFFSTVASFPYFLCSFVHITCWPTVYFLDYLFLDCHPTKSCPTPCDSMDYSLPVFAAHGIFQARRLEWIAISYSRGSSQPGIESTSPAWQVDCLPLSPLGSPSWRLPYNKLIHWLYRDACLIFQSQDTVSVGCAFFISSVLSQVSSTEYRIMLGDNSSNSKFSWTPPLLPQPTNSPWEKNPPPITGTPGSF